jgi:hypothetical protein
MSEQFWFKDPAILFKKDTWSKFVPLQTMTTAEALNSVVRFTIYFAGIMSLATGEGIYMLSIPLVMIATVILGNVFPNGKTLESFSLDLGGTKVKDTTEYTMPTKDNPFMNVLLTEIKDNPNRPDAAPTMRRDVKDKIYKAFQQTSDIYMDTSDLFDQAQAMRTFHTLQSAKVPNDQDGFLKWLAKGWDAPDFSSAPPARFGKIKNEGYVDAVGSMKELSSTTAKPTGTSPSTFAPSSSSK